MSFRKTLSQIIYEEERLYKDKKLQDECALPENCYFLSEDNILCYKRSTGDARYPYSSDGLTLWAYSSGYMSLNESTFYWILPADEGKEPYLNFFGGIKKQCAKNESDTENEGGFLPVSITGICKRYDDNYRRFTVYTPTAVYYVTKTPNIVFCLRAFVSKDKKACFSVCALNQSEKRQQIYLSSYFNCLFMHQAGEHFETKWFKQCSLGENGYLFESVEDLSRTVHLENFGQLIREVTGIVTSHSHTTSKKDFCGGKNNSLWDAYPLFLGKFEKQKTVCRFSETAAAGDIYCFDLNIDDFCQIDYILQSTTEKVIDISDFPVKTYIDNRLIEALLQDQIKQNSPNMLKIKFGEFTNKSISGDILTKFTANVIRQVNFAAMAKNSGVSLLGVRDVAQQLEAAIIWNKSNSRAKILEVLGFLDPSGRAPRQYSIPAKGALPQMDTREFIDQGVWIIDMIYAYLCYTGDYTLLDEIVGYYKITGVNLVAETTLKDSVFDHMTAILDYLIANIDENTNCVKALYGDWNDALDGLGITKDSGKDFGSGVSVMTTLQLYLNLSNMLEIISVTGDRKLRKSLYETTKNRLIAGLTQNAIVYSDDKKARKILHGWGDKRSYFAGSFCDADGKSRDSLTANAFWVISDMYLLDTSIKQDILNAFKNLDSKYGLKTFEPYFEKDAKGFGRIVNLPKGTAENGATYVHGALFGIRSLFKMGESKLAWEQLEKVLPITHKLITTTPFVMSNSYSYNEELDLDGESMSDWFTGSANLLIKTLVKDVFGVNPSLDKICLSPAMYMPFKDGELSLKIQNTRLTVKYKNMGLNQREFLVNGKKFPSSINNANGVCEIYLNKSALNENIVVEVLD